MVTYYIFILIIKIRRNIVNEIEIKNRIYKFLIMVRLKQYIKRQKDIQTLWDLIKVNIYIRTPRQMNTIFFWRLLINNLISIQLFLFYAILKMTDFTWCAIIKQYIIIKSSKGLHKRICQILIVMVKWFVHFKHIHLCRPSKLHII